MERRAAGFALLAVLAILGLAALGFALARADLGAQARNRAHQLSVTALAQARTALIGYAISYADIHVDQSYGVLPCPDADGDGRTSAAECGAGGETAFGRLPYALAGLADVRDGWGECLWYAVAGAVKETPAATPLNWDTVGPFEILAADGARLTSAADPHGRAVAVVFAPAQPLASQRRPAGNGGPCSGSGTAADLPHYLEGGYGMGEDGAIQVHLGSPDGETNNDLAAWITPTDIFDQLKRRADFAAFIDAIIDHAEAALQERLAARGFCADFAGLPCSGGIDVGRLPEAAVLGLTGRAAVLHDHWRDQFWFATCSDGEACLRARVDGARFDCRAVLLFGGERLRGEFAQRRATAAERNDPAQYAEGENAVSLAGEAGVFSGLAHFAADPTGEPASGDVIRCLN